MNHSLKISHLKKYVCFSLIIALLTNTIAAAFEPSQGPSRFESDITEILNAGVASIQRLLDAKIYDGPNSEALFFKHLNHAMEETRKEVASWTEDQVQAQYDGLLSRAEMLQALSDTTELRLAIAKELTAIKAERRGDASGESPVRVFLQQAQSKFLNRGYSVSFDWWKTLWIALLPIAVVIEHFVLPYTVAFLLWGTGVFIIVVSLALPMIFGDSVDPVRWFHKPVKSVADLSQSGEPKVEVSYPEGDNYAWWQFFSIHGGTVTGERLDFIKALQTLHLGLQQLKANTAVVSAEERARKKNVFLTRLAQLDAQAEALRVASRTRAWASAFESSYHVYEDDSLLTRKMILAGLNAESGGNPSREEMKK